MPVPDRSFARTVVSIGGGGVQNPVVVTGGIDGISGSLLTRRHMPGAVGGGLGDRSRVVCSQVHYVQKKTFVGNLWRFVNLYIFGKLITPGVQKIMFTFAQPPLTLVAMATKIWEF